MRVVLMKLILMKEKPQTKNYRCLCHLEKWTAFGGRRCADMLIYWVLVLSWSLCYCWRQD